LYENVKEQGGDKVIYVSHMLSPHRWRVTIDLCDDLNTVAYKNLLAMGYKDVSKDDALNLYYNYIKRKVNRRPRKVYIAKEMKCPEGYEVALAEFISKVESGENLVPFQSQKILQVDYNDLLLNDWNIHHFHLTRRMRTDGFACRSNYQLFAYITDVSFYIIQIYPHDTVDLYSRQDMVRILHNNWPEAISRYRIKGAESLLEEIDDHQYGQLRDSHISTFVEVEKGCIYGMLGGGYMSDGFSTEVLMAADKWRRIAQVFEEQIINNMNTTQLTLENYIGKPVKEFEYHLLWIDSEDEFTIAERKSHTILQYNLKKGYFRICYPSYVFGDTIDSILGRCRIPGMMCFR